MAWRFASRSSPSLDLDEDTSKPQVAPDSLDFQCQSVLQENLDDRAAFSFDRTHDNGEVADSGGELKVSFDPKCLQQPTQPSAHDRELLNMTHIPSPWCVVCSEAKVSASQHRKKTHSTKISIIQLAYAYINQPQDQEPSLILLWVESLTGLADSLIAIEKGTSAQQLDAVVTFIQRHGFDHSTLQCDEEPALVKIVEEIGKQTSLPIRMSPARNTKLAGWKRSLFTQFRALWLDFSQRHKLHPSSLMIGSSLGQHMLRHAVWLLNRFKLHFSDNKTGFQRRWGTAYSSPVLPFGELSWLQIKA